MGFFGREGIGDGFTLFGPAHLLSLAVVAVLLVWLVRTYRDTSEEKRRAGRIMIVVMLWGQELSYHAWKISIGEWNLQTMLPFHLCTMAVWLGGVALLLRSRTLADYLYFVALAGATQALLTPDIGVYGFPHYRFWQFFVSHGLIVATAVWLTFVEGFYPTARSLVRAIVATVVFGLTMIGVNAIFHSNYMFVSHKPETASALDLMPPWPTYLWFLAALVVIVYSLLYLPWAIRNGRGQARASR